jgi:hypothetical protein
MLSCDLSRGAVTVSSQEAACNGSSSRPFSSLYIFGTFFSRTTDDTAVKVDASNASLLFGGAQITSGLPIKISLSTVHISWAGSNSLQWNGVGHAVGISCAGNANVTFSGPGSFFANSTQYAPIGSTGIGALAGEICGDLTFLNGSYDIDSGKFSTAIGTSTGQSSGTILRNLAFHGGSFDLRGQFGTRIGAGMADETLSAVENLTILNGTFVMGASTTTGIGGSLTKFYPDSVVNRTHISGGNFSIQSIDVPAIDITGDVLSFQGGTFRLNVSGSDHAIEYHSQKTPLRFAHGNVAIQCNSNVACVKADTIEFVDSVSVSAVTSTPLFFQANSTQFGVDANLTIFYTGISYNENLSGGALHFGRINGLPEVDCQLSFRRLTGEVLSLSYRASEFTGLLVSLPGRTAYQVEFWDEMGYLCTTSNETVFSVGVTEAFFSDVFVCMETNETLPPDATILPTLTTLRTPSITSTPVSSPRQSVTMSPLTSPKATPPETPPITMALTPQISESPHATRIRSAVATESPLPTRSVYPTADESMTEVNILIVTGVAAALLVIIFLIGVTCYVRKQAKHNRDGQMFVFAGVDDDSSGYRALSVDPY